MAATESLETDGQLLHVFETELRLLRAKYIAEKKTDAEIRKAAAPLIELMQNVKEHRHKSRGTLVKFMILPLVALAFSGLMYNNTTYRFLAYAARRTFVLTAPYVDWTGLSSQNCIIPNILKVERYNVPESCDECERITEVPILLQASMEKVANEYVEKNLPVIAIDDTPQKKTSLEDLYELYVVDDVMSLYTACEFNTSLNISSIKNQRGLLSALHYGHENSFYAHWKNCFEDGAKLFRRVFNRPDCIPPSIELQTSNWAFVCTNYEKHIPIELPMKGDFFVLLQLSGELDLVLKPRDPCSNNCTTITTTLQEGASLLMTNFFYDVEYITCTAGTSITVGLTGSTDI